jgi:hypothetical protein
MAERRMFAKTIIDSDAFLDMPQSSQLLYFHLAMRADDDGFINNPKSITRNVKCNEDDLTLLTAKKFIIPFQSGIVVIKHWKIHNYIRSDRYKRTKCLEELAVLSLDENSSYTLNQLKKVENGIPSDNQTATNGIPLVDKMDTQVRLGEVRLGEVRLGNTSSEILQIPDRIPYQKIVDAFNEICTSLTKVKGLTEGRKSAIKARYKDLNYSLDKVKEYFTQVQKSDFLTGKVEREGKRPFKATFDWVIKSANYVKIIEGNYENKEASYGTSGKHSTEVKNTSKWGKLEGIIHL